MPQINVNDCNGSINWGPFRLAWGNALNDLDLPGFVTLCWNEYALEFGQVDQDRPGVYFTVLEDGDLQTSKALLQF